ncbi:MAG: PilW family protein [Steroidobacteraceae bacterium]
MKKRNQGFTLVEVMIALVIASITAVVVLNVLSSFQTRKQTTAGTNEAAISASLGMYAIEREVRMAGAGYTNALGLACPQGVNIAYNGATVVDGGQVMPLMIVDGGGNNPDQINIVRSNADLGVAPATVMAPMATAVANVIVDRNAGFNVNDLLLVTSNDGSQRCTIMQLSGAPTALGGNWQLPHTSALPYNPATPTAVFTNAALYQPRDSVVNLGNYGQRRFQVVCNVGAVPVDTNVCDLKWFDPLALAVAPTMANTESIVSQVVDVQAQYGVAPAGSQVVNAWVDATGAWAGVPSAANLARIKAVRISIVTRGERDNTSPVPPTPAAVPLWTTPAVRNHVFTAAERRYRYQVLTVVVPLINVIWAGV